MFSNYSKLYKKTTYIFLIFLVFFSSNIYAFVLNDELQVNKPFLQKLDKVKVEKVIDGDSLVVTGGKILRLIGVDTPEYMESFYAKTATEYTKDKLLGEKVYLEYDKGKYDNYNRELVYVYLEDGEFFNASLLRKGHACLISVSPNKKHEKLLRSMAEKALEKEEGMWKALPIINWKYADDHRGELVIIHGKIVSTYDSGQVVFLNFAEEYWHTFSAVIFSEDLLNFDFSPAQYYHNREVLILGKILEYQGSPEIIINFPEQIKVYP